MLEFSESTAVILQEPLLFAVTNPVVSLTDAIVVLLDDHLTSLESVVLDGFIIEYNWRVLPFSNVPLEDIISDIYKKEAK